MFSKVSYVDVNSVFFVDYYLDDKYISTYGFGARSSYESLLDVFKRALSKFDYLNTRARKNLILQSYTIKLKDKEGNLIKIIHFDKEALKIS